MNQKMLRVLLLSSLLLSAFIQTGCSFKQFSENITSTEDDIREAVFRYYFGSRYANGTEDLNYIFLSIQNQDPNPALLQRLNGHSPTVAPISMANLIPGKGIAHKSEAQASGVIFTISKVKWVSKYQVTVECQNTSTHLGVSGGLMKLKYVKGEWKVVSHSLIWISQNHKNKNTKPIPNQNFTIMSLNDVLASIDR